LISVPATVRICTSAAERARSLDIYNEVWPRRGVTSEDVEAWKRTSLASVEFLGSVDGVDGGSAAAALYTSRPTTAEVLVTVLQNFRRRGLGSALLRAAATWAVEHGAEELDTRVEADDEESVGFALRRGFGVHSRELGLELQLHGLEPGPVDPPAGIEIALLAERAELAAGAYSVGVEALPDIPGNEDWTPPPFDEFAANNLRGLAVFVAVADGEVVGYAKLHARPDGRTADHGMTAVKRAWRGRGIATSLKRAEIAWAKAHGIERLTASNEERNVPMQRLNASLGYRPVPGRVQLRRPVGEWKLP
jgi:mycothiol synthase